MIPPGAVEGVGRRMVAGIGWTVGARAAGRVLGVLGVAVLARLLEPSDFGLVALATGIAAAIEISASLDFRIWLVRLAEPRASHYHTFWTLSVLRGAAIAAVLVAGSGPMAAVFDEPRLQPVLVAIAAGTALGGLRNPGVVDFERDLRFDREFWLLTAPRLGALVVTVALGLWWRSYWALVAGLLARRAIDLALSYTVHPMRPRLSTRHWRDAFDFSKWLLLGNLVSFGYRRADVFLLGKIAGAQALGLYSIAREISDLASSELVTPIRRVMLPGFSRLGADPEAVRRTFLDGFALIVLVGLPCTVGIALLADPLVRVFLGEQWLESIPLVRILAVYGLSAVVMANQHPLLLALGRTRATAALYALGLVLLVPSFAWAAGAYGAAGGAAAVGATNVVVLVASLALSLRLISVTFAGLAAATWRAVLGVLGMSLAVAGVLSIAEGWWPAATLAVGVGVGAASYAAAVYLAWRVRGAPRGPERQLIDYLAGLRRPRVRPAGAAS